jgi:pseudouridine kinase
MPPARPAAAPQVVCIGGASRDSKLRAVGPIAPGTSNPVRGRRMFGGVARNVAENLARLCIRTALLSRVGDDEAGRALLRHLDESGVDTTLVSRDAQAATAEYIAVLSPSGELCCGFAEMEILDGLTPQVLAAAATELAEADIVFADCNCPAETLAALVARLPARGALAVDAVSCAKVARLPRDLSGIDLLFLNIDEAVAWLETEASARAPEALAAALRAQGVARVVLTLGAGGLIAADEAGMARLDAVEARMVDATGAGDALVAAVLAGLVGGAPFLDAVRQGMRAAALTVESPFSVRPDLSRSLLDGGSARGGGGRGG